MNIQITNTQIQFLDTKKVFYNVHVYNKHIQRHAFYRLFWDPLR